MALGKIDVAIQNRIDDSKALPPGVTDWMLLRFSGAGVLHRRRHWECIPLKFGCLSAILVSTDRSILDPEIILQFLFILTERIRIMATSDQPADAG